MDTVFQLNQQLQIKTHWKGIYWLTGLDQYRATALFVLIRTEWLVAAAAATAAAEFRQLKGFWSGLGSRFWSRFARTRVKGATAASTAAATAAATSLLIWSKGKHDKSFEIVQPKSYGCQSL
jgi:hypothetical protein